VEVKIGVADSGRELVLNSSAEPEDIEAQVTESLKKADATLVLVDEKGKKLMIPSAKIAYVEIGQSVSRRVGFGS
jgi:hypothetical protein